MRMIVACVVVAAMVLGVLVAGCQPGGDGADDETSGNGISGAWTLDVKAENGSFQYRSTDLLITATADSTYRTDWTYATEDGTSAYDVNSETVVIDQPGTVGNLHLSGIRTGKNEMRGGGTLEGPGGINAVEWTAKRSE